MIAEIIFWLEQTDHLNLPTTLGSDFKKAAEELLCRIEEAGMLPPETKATPEDFANTGFTQEFLDEHDFTVNKWDEE
jgi:hypothetical protein